MKISGKWRPNKCWFKDTILPWMVQQPEIGNQKLFGGKGFRREVRHGVASMSLKH